MTRLVRVLTRPVGIALAVVAMTAFTAASCSYADPPVMTMAVNGKEPPFFTMSWDDLQKKLQDANAATSASSTTQPTYYAAANIATILTQSAQDEALQKILADRKIQPNDADTAKAQQDASSSQQGTPSQADITRSAQIYALQRSLAEAAFASGQVDKEKTIQTYFDQNKDSLSTPDQVCLHGIFVLPNASGQPATDAEMAAAMAKGKDIQQRLATEDFAKVDDEVSVSAAKQKYPGGDLGCVSKANGGFDDTQWQAVSTALPNTVVAPMDLGGSIVVVFRVDSFKAGQAATLQGARAQIEQAVTYGTGQQLQGAFIESIAKDYVVVVDPHYGLWDPTQFVVKPPDGAAQPTVPTTTTTTAPSLLPTATTAPTNAPTTTTVPASTGSVPGTTP